MNKLNSFFKPRSIVKVILLGFFTVSLGSCGTQDGSGGGEDLAVVSSARANVIPSTGTSCVSVVDGSTGGISKPYFSLQKLQYKWSGTSDLNVTTIQVRMSALGQKLPTYVLPDDEMAAMLCGVTDIASCSGLNISGSLPADSTARLVSNVCVLRVPVKLDGIKQNTTITGTVRITGTATDADGNESSVYGESYFSAEYEYVNDDSAN